MNSMAYYLNMLFSTPDEDHGASNEYCEGKFHYSLCLETAISGNHGIFNKLLSYLQFILNLKKS